jgi:hypothetical protein
VAGPCEHGNETSASIKGSGILDWLRDFQFLKKDFTVQLVGSSFT